MFVFGSPRSGTTFLAGAIGSLPGFVDLGEVPPLKAAIPELASLPPEQAASRLRRLLWPTRRLGGVAGLRGVEQTPESVFIGKAILRAYPHAVLIHLVRDGRDVVCSLLERAWLSPAREGRDDAGAAFGSGARFWVERGSEPEFAQAGDARRCAWAWRRYVAAARSLGDPAHELRYEQLCADPDAVAIGLQLLTIALARKRGVNPDLLRREEEPYREAARLGEKKTAEVFLEATADA